MPCGIVNILCNALTLFELRHFFEFEVGKAEFIVVFVEFFVCLRDFLVLSVNLQRKN